MDSFRQVLLSPGVNGDKIMFGLAGLQFSFFFFKSISFVVVRLLCCCWVFWWWLFLGGRVVCRFFRFINSFVLAFISAIRDRLTQCVCVRMCARACAHTCANSRSGALKELFCSSGALKELFCSTEEVKTKTQKIWHKNAPLIICSSTPNEWLDRLHSNTTMAGVQFSHCLKTGSSRQQNALRSVVTLYPSGLGSQVLKQNQSSFFVLVLLFFSLSLSLFRLLETLAFLDKTFSCDKSCSFKVVFIRDL